MFRISLIGVRRVASLAAVAAFAVGCGPAATASPTAATELMPTFNSNTITFNLENGWTESVAVLVRQVGGPQVVGSADPPVAAPLATTEVTITVPAAQTWEVVVNPTDPRNGGLFGSHEVGSCRGKLEVTVSVQSNGDTGWRGPGPDPVVPC